MPARQALYEIGRGRKRYGGGSYKEKIAGT